MFFNNFSYVLAGRDDPLIEHKDYVEEIRKEFEWNERDKQSSTYPILWKKEPSFWFWDSDYRVVRVYNIPYLMGQKHSENFFVATMKLLLESVKLCKYSSKLAKATGKEALKILNSGLKKSKQNSWEAKVLSNILGTDEEMAIDSFVTAFGYSCMSKVCHGLCMVDTLVRIFVAGNPVTEVAMMMIDIASLLFTKGKFAQERIKNCAIALNQIYDIIQNDSERVLDSNVLVTAIDERNFTAWFRHNAWRRDDEAWCDFLKIGGLKCAPTGREYKNGEVVKFCSRMFNEIMCNGRLDLNKIERFITNGEWPRIEKSLSSCKISDDEED